VKVKVYKADGKYVKSATTKSSGLYELKNISPGAYYLQFVFPKRYGFAPTDQGTDYIAEFCVVSTPIGTAVVAPNVGEGEETWDVGISHSMTSTSNESSSSSDSNKQNPSDFSWGFKIGGYTKYVAPGSSNGAVTDQNAGDVCPPGHSEGKKTGWDNKDAHPGSSNGGKTDQNGGEASPGGSNGNKTGSDNKDAPPGSSNGGGKGKGN